MTRLWMLLALVCSISTTGAQELTVGQIKNMLCQVEQYMENNNLLNAGSGSIKIAEEALYESLTCLCTSGFNTSCILRDCLSITNQNAPNSSTLFCTKFQQCNVPDIGVQLPNPVVFATCVATQGLGSLGKTIVGQLGNVLGGVASTAANPVKTVGQAVGGAMGTVGNIGGTLIKDMGDDFGLFFDCC
ncbi:hypothetical protein PRIPAC_76268 [Pristionchus pacificus]|uniref:Uncharacterized protein n=1 Tax=Pristionchus pacificus TaxID=54126 RepID=A0A2A6BZQ9_PRIPA|nr:hypothetical protein PRIPAC_72143 [Pristionchus pacificus]KAF8385685.1 hypothetical protein PRIPAC_74827 [Pristionchus pacificus]KAF8387126.1 hypothetical protein PRIPAC_76268 [Pristionchus pacificus]|eukprot:PDM71336.1 hypothetical protein PRIPAC_37743 [Pristionchus pacificus]